MECVVQGALRSRPPTAWMANCAAVTRRGIRSDGCADGRWCADYFAQQCGSGEMRVSGPIGECDWRDQNGTWWTGMATNDLSSVQTCRGTRARQRAADQD